MSKKLITGLIHNIPVQQGLIQFQLNHKCSKCGGNKCNHIQLHTGFHDGITPSLRTHILNEILVAILLNDRLILTSDDSLWISQYFNLSDLRKLFESNIFQIVDCSLASGVILQDNNKKATLDISTISKPLMDNWEAKLAKLSPTGKLNLPSNSILYNIESNKIDIPYNEFKDELFEEVEFDLSNERFRQKFRLNSKGLEDIRFADYMQILRLFHNNKALALASRLEVDNVVLEASSKDLIYSKLRPTIFRKYFKRTQSVDIFEEIINAKGIPNLGELFVAQIINIDDILNLRNNIDGQFFRHWFYNQGYDKDLLLETLLNGRDQSVLASQINKVRWLIPPIVGLVGGSPAGVVAAYANSTIVSKLLNGWHPNLFLDEQLRKSVLAKNRKHQNLQLHAKATRRGKKIGRNEPCPCGSGKKHKHCHGKKY